MKRIELFNDSYQNFKVYQIPHAQLIMADVPYCYDEQTECWTKRGWVKYNEIKKDDIVMTIEPVSQKIEYSEIEQIIIRNCQEPMYSFESGNMNFLVTENHRMYCDRTISTRTFGGKLVTKKIIGDIRASQNMNPSCYIPTTGYQWDNNTIFDFEIPSCAIRTNGREQILEPVKIDLENWLPFFGLWLADGCTCNSHAKNGRQLYTVSIKQHNKKRQLIREILNKLPFKYHEYENKNANSSNFNIFSKQLWLYLKQFGKAKDKFIPRWILDLPKKYLEIFWNAYTFGDSTVLGKGLRILSISETLILNLQEIALKLGTVCQIRQIKHKSWKNTLFYFQYNTKKKSAVFSTKKKIDDYNGIVWCIKCKKNGVFLVRRNGIINFCGNCIGEKAYASNPMWYNGGDNANGESKLAGKTFFDTDWNFKPAEFMHFCSQMLVKEPKNGYRENEDAETIGKSGKVKSKAPCMVLFCAFEQLHYFIELGQRYGFQHYIPLVFRKNFSAQVLKANMKIVGNCEYGLVLYKDKLPKFNNEGRMVFNCIDWPRDNKTPKIHPTQKSVPLLEFLIRLFTDPDDVVIDPCAGSGSTLLAAANLGRKAYGFEIKKDFYQRACKLLEENVQPQLF